MPMTLDEIRREGLAALRERLGRTGMLRFLQQFESGQGNYSRSRHDWVDSTSLDAIRTMAVRPAKTKPRKKS